MHRCRPHAPLQASCTAAGLTAAPTLHTDTPCTTLPPPAAGDGNRTRLGVSRHASRDNDAGPQLTQRQVQMQARLTALHASSDDDDDAFFEQQLEEPPRRPVAEGPRRPGRPAKPKDDREPLRNRENPWLDALKGRFKPIQVGGGKKCGWWQGVWGTAWWLDALEGRFTPVHVGGGRGGGRVGALCGTVSGG
jgi:hypothetical protein